MAELKTEIECLRALVYKGDRRAHGRRGHDRTGVDGQAQGGRCAARSPTRACSTGAAWASRWTTRCRELSRLRLISIGGGADEVMLQIICKRMGILPTDLALPASPPALPMTRRFDTLLVANRGEIACASCARHAPGPAHGGRLFRRRPAQPARGSTPTLALPPGPAPARDLPVHRAPDRRGARAAAPAVHPGYGFLSENAAFAAAVQRRRIGVRRPQPRRRSTLMGNKAAAKVRMNRCRRALPARLAGRRGAGQRHAGAARRSASASR
jgi:hypothetical protein